MAATSAEFSIVSFVKVMVSILGDGNMMETCVSQYSSKILDYGILQVKRAYEAVQKRKQYLGCTRLMQFWAAWREIEIGHPSCRERHVFQVGTAEGDVPGAR